MIAYASLAGLPPHAGLYTLLASLVLYAIFGTSRQLVVAGTSASAVLVYSAVTALHPKDTPTYVGLAAGFIFLTGVLFLASGLFRLGFITQFLSRPVMEGFIFGLAIFLSVAGAGGASKSGTPATWVGWLKIGLGVLLLLVAVRQFRGRPHDVDEPQMPNWMTTIDKITPLGALGLAAVLAALLSGANPKNLLLAAGGAAAIAQTGISGAAGHRLRGVRAHRHPRRGHPGRHLLRPG
jgi:hypothetical protein